MGLGDLSAAKGDKDEAEKYYAQAEALYQQNRAAGMDDPMLMAKFYADHDRHLDDALRLAEERKLTKNVLEADILAWVYFKNGDQPHAIAAMKLALSRKTAEAEMQYHAGMIRGGGERPRFRAEALAAGAQLQPAFQPVASAGGGRDSGKARQRSACGGKRYQDAVRPPHPFQPS